MTFVLCYQSMPITSVMTDVNCEGLPICDDRITENDRYVIKIIGIHCAVESLLSS